MDFWTLVSELSEAIGGIKFIFRMRVHMLKEAIKTLRSQKLKKVQSWFFECNFIFIKVINWLCKFMWVWSGMPRHTQRVF